MLQGVLIVEDFTAPHKHLAPVPDPLGSITHNHYTVLAVSNQPNSRNCAYRRAKMASASPRQLPRKRRTTVWRPGEVSTRSLGNSSTPVLTSWNGPSFTGGKGGSGSAPVRRRRCLRTCMPNMLPSTLSTTLAEPPVWRHLPCDCRHGIGSSLRYNRRPTRPIAGLPSKTLMGLISTPHSNQAHCAASVYGAPTASKAHRRASEPLMRPGSTPSRSSSDRRSSLQAGHR